MPYVSTLSVLLGSFLRSSSVCADAETVARASTATAIATRVMSLAPLDIEGSAQLSKPEFPIGTSGSRSINFSCLRHNEFATRAGPTRIQLWKRPSFRGVGGVYEQSGNGTDWLIWRTNREGSPIVTGNDVWKRFNRAHSV